VGEAQAVLLYRCDKRVFHRPLALEIKQDCDLEIVVAYTGMCELPYTMVQGRARIPLTPRLKLRSDTLQRPKRAWLTDLMTLIEG
jgi:hypothetical protein